MAGIVEGAVTGVRVVKGFGQEEQEIGRLEDASSALFASRMRAVRLTARYNPALQAVPRSARSACWPSAAGWRIKGSITLGTFLAFSRTWRSWSARSGCWPRWSRSASRPGPA